MIIKDMTGAECTAVLTANRLARLACSQDGLPYVVPIFYSYAGLYAYAFTMPGRKLEMMRANPNVALLIEEQGESQNWKSVLMEGRFEELPDRIGYKREREHAWSLLSKYANWWEPGALKPAPQPIADHSPHVFFRIHLERTSGRQAVEE